MDTDTIRMPRPGRSNPNATPGIYGGHSNVTTSPGMGPYVQQMMAAFADPLPDRNPNGTVGQPTATVNPAGPPAQWIQQLMGAMQPPPGGPPVAAGGGRYMPGNQQQVLPSAQRPQIPQAPPRAAAQSFAPTNNALPMSARPYTAYGPSGTGGGYG